MDDRIIKSEFLKKATQEVNRKAAEIANHPYRQKYHFEVPSGWCNDPNGFSFQRGEYQLFYQHMPYDADPADFVMYWGHAKSKDLVHWEELPIAIGPENEYDQKGCWSGCSFEKDGKMVVYYTGLDGEAWQKQSMAISEDGVNFVKYENNPVLGETLCEADPVDFRDPFIWKHEGKMYMLIGSKKNGFGCIPLYVSEDGLNWEFKNYLVESLGELGTVCECPNFFEVDGKYVLFISPHGMNHRKSLYLVGDFDYKTGKFFWHNYGEIDWGMDYYAPQVIVDEKGRRISIAWTNSWAWMPWSDGTYFTTELGWSGAMSLPRKMYLNKEQQLCCEPVEELQTLRGDAYEWNDVIVGEEKSFAVSTKDNRHSEMKFSFNLEKTTASQVEFIIGKEDAEHVKFTFKIDKGEVVFDRSADSRKKNDVRKCNVKSLTQDKMELHIYLDSSSAEIFTDGYATAMTNMFYLPEEATDVIIKAIGGEVVIPVIKAWEMKSAKK